VGPHRVSPSLIIPESRQVTRAQRSKGRRQSSANPARPLRRGATALGAAGADAVAGGASRASTYQAKAAPASRAPGTQKALRQPLWPTSQPAKAHEAAWPTT
jgi:hypothetical protein